ncbi:hypothetical protein FB451DRAFT_1557247 [Mycena latifolia]|nr:hypothetical protein FB451DRAFT_1557247 [Mycena latifolia]
MMQQRFSVDVTCALHGSAPDPGGPAGFYAVNTISNMLFFAQAIASTIMGDQINSVLTDVFDADFDAFKLILMIFPDGVPANMTVATSGIIFSQSVGWNHLAPGSVWVLIPGAIVAHVTVVFILIAVAQYVGDAPREVCDPSNAMHLVAAAAAGRLSDAVTGTGEQDIQAAERVNIVLWSIPGQKPALIRTEGRERHFACECNSIMSRSISSY